MKNIFTLICLLFSVALMAQSAPKSSDARKINMSRTNASPVKAELGVTDGPAASTIGKGTFGIKVQPVEGGLQIKGFDDQNSSARAAKLKEGDIITAINSKTITNQLEMNNALVAYEPGDVVTIHYMRGNRKLTKDVRVGK